MTVNEIVEHITDSFDRTYNDEYEAGIRPLIWATRAMLIKRRLDKDGHDVKYESSIDVPVIIDTLEELCVSEGCKILRTEEKVPKSLHKSGAPYKVRNINKRTQYEYTTAEKLEYAQYRQFTDTYRKYLYYNDYIYLPVVESTMLFMKNINITAIFTDMEDAFTQCSNCKPANETEIEEDLVMPIITEIKRQMVQFVPETDNQEVDAKDNNTNR